MMDDVNTNANVTKHALYVIYGPTASGKTRLAIDIAHHIGADKSVIINADSLQIYQGLPILSACPNAHEYQQADHLLFEILNPHEKNSVGRWWDMVVNTINEAIKMGKTPILVGGTGMYIKSFLCGLAPIPETDEGLRETLNKKMDEIGVNAFYEELIALDPMAENRIEKDNPRRLVRAFEVKKSTGKSIYEWHDMPANTHGLPLDIHYISLAPDRDWLYERCNRRFDMMIDAGAVEEVQNFNLTYGLDTVSMKAIGYDEINAVIKGEMDIDTARDVACQKTRNYAKRQLTWGRTQMNEDALKGCVKTWQEITMPDIKKLNLN